MILTLASNGKPGAIWRRTLGMIAMLVMLPSSYTFGQQDIATLLRETVERADSSHAPIVLFEGVILHNNLLLPFYQSNNFALAWKQKGNIDALIEAVRQSFEEGLNPEDYHVQALDNFKRDQPIGSNAIFFDLMLTDAFLDYGSHLQSGKLNPVELYPDEWQAKSEGIDLVPVLQKALSDRTIGKTLDGLKPSGIDYEKLREYLHSYRDIKAKGGWPQIAAGPSIEPGMRDERILSIRRRLAITGQWIDLDRLQDDQVYDSVLANSIRKFQQQNGLEDDGSIGKRTLQCLNYSVDEYIDKIMVNLERYRWLSGTLEARGIWVNIPAYSADVYEGDSIVLSMRAILGRPERKTPVLSGILQTLVYNPTWTVPPTILEEDVLPAVKKNTNYLKTHNLRVIDYSGNEIAPEGLPWASYSASNFPFLLRQDPGKNNPLGLIKFEFPNRHRVFLHDTNNPSLFNQPYRALSSGCIRIEKPYALGAYVLRGSSWTEEKLRAAVRTHETGTISIHRIVPIRTVYLTTFVDSDYVLQIRNDVYDWDGRVWDLL